MTREELKKQLIRDYLGDYLEQCFKEGYEKGYREGREQAREEIVSNLLEAGMKPEEIAAGAKIHIERVLEIKANHDFRYHADSLYRIENKRNINILVKLERRD